MWFQHDVAPAHFSADVRSILDTAYPGRWIGRGGSVNWPVRSPDLSCLDFFLWGHMKSIVYASPVDFDEALTIDGDTTYQPPPPPPPQFWHETEGRGKYSPVPCTRDSAHKTFGPPDLTSTYSVCTRRVFGGIGPGLPVWSSML
ncbi:uncharacterized protein TNCV_3083631 [Trichonephila clavipes]|nr:uncharacterized protein TNCV_3083631 [Trichonephila clavipes]